jgi:hypothetical protein
MYDMKYAGAPGAPEQTSNGFDKALIMRVPPASRCQVQSDLSFDRMN